MGGEHFADLFRKPQEEFSSHPRARVEQNSSSVDRLEPARRKAAEVTTLISFKR